MVPVYYWVMSPSNGWLFASSGEHAFKIQWLCILVNMFKRANLSKGVQILSGNIGFVTCVRDAFIMLHNVDTIGLVLSTTERSATTS